MNLLILKGFNNYFNRKIKKYADIADYISNSALSYTFSNINFDPNDGVATSQVLGSENQKEEDNKVLQWEFEGTPDYLVCYESEFVHNEDESVTEIKHIKSRWFVLECVRTRAGQYQLALKRDVIADHLEQILTNPCFVEKGYVAPNDPLIFNDEGASFNEIKQSETTLKDETDVPWIVMYIAKNFPDASTPGLNNEGNLPIEGQMVLDTSQAIDVSDLPWYNIIQTPAVGKTYRVKGASGICISPIIAAKADQVGVGKYLLAPVRANMRYYYKADSNKWEINKAISNSERIGVYSTLVDSPFAATDGYILLNKAIGLTPANDSVRWNATGNMVPAFWQSTRLGSSLRYEDVVAAGNWLIEHGGLADGNTEAGKTAITNYLTSKMNWLKTSVLHSAVPGNPNMEAYVGGNQTFIPEVQLLSYNDKLVRSGANYYRLKIKRQNNYRTKIDYFIKDEQGVIHPNNVSPVISGGTLISGTDIINNFTYNWENNRAVETWAESAWFDIQYEKVSGDLLRFTLPKPSSRVQLNDAAYDMITFPYGAIDFKVPNDNNPPTANLSFTSSKEASIGIARSIASAIGDAVYDVQLLPYCPYREIAEQYAEDGYIDIGKDSPFPYGAWSGVYKIASAGDPPYRTNSVSFGLWCNSSHGTFDITHVIETPLAGDSVEYKVFNACKKFRLVAPNYSSVFEFNPLKNNGVTIFNVDFTYKPYNPYIHIAPFFNSDGLYGVDTNDNRGLILQGDFSVGYYSSAWANYQIQNANYANIFNRQIENIDFNQAQEREKQTWNNWTTGITETLGLGGGLQGAKAFSGLGPWGMLGGGIGGTVGGMVGAGVGLTKDWEWLRESQREEKSYATDMYNYALGNIKALPYGLAKSDALTENFKYFPFIEVYDCTDKEVELFKAKLLYDGMTVGAIGELQSYIPPEDSSWSFQRLKGRLIIQDNLIDDFQIANAIYTEVNKGFYYVNQYIPPVEEDSD